MEETATGGDFLKGLRWRCPSQPLATAALIRVIPRHNPGEPFLKGPIPLRWLELAARQPGKALHVAVALWHRTGMARSARVKINLSRLDALGVDRYAGSRGLKALESARLIRVDRGQGRTATVTLLEIPAEVTTRSDASRDGSA